MQEKILRYFRKHPHSYYQKSEVQRHLNIGKKSQAEFRRALRNLVQEGKIVSVKKKGYCWSGGLTKLRGTVELTQRGFGFLLVEDGDDVFINMRDLGGAVNGDMVEVTILPSDYSRGPRGKIARILKRGTDRFVGTVYYHRREAHLAIEPVTPLRGIRIVGDGVKKLHEGDAIISKVRDWGRGRGAIHVVLEKIIGSTRNPQDDMKIVCSAFDLDPTFPKAVQSEAEKFTEQDIVAEIKNRKDLRDLDCFTIDPKEAKDFDDAISMKENKDGTTTVGIHIADVSYFVKSGSALDQEARYRGTSVYFAEGVVHMLPQNLSSGVCSLLPDRDRLASSLIITLDKNCKVLDWKFHSSVIKNKKRFTYREVQAIVDGKEKSPYVKTLLAMRKVAKRLHNLRQEAGSIDFDIPEPIFFFRDGGIPHEIRHSERLESHRLVEEFMLLANRVIAENVPFDGSQNRPFIYRIHDKPQRENMERFVDLLRRLNLIKSRLKSLSSNEFRKILSMVEDSPYRALIENIALRTMTKAIYSTDNRGHYGLAFEHYTHFTSPIRRYPDLVVHRLIKQYLGSQSGSQQIQKKKSLNRLAKSNTESEIIAQKAERDYIRLKQIRWLAERVGESFEGIISGVIGRGLFVELKDTLVEGFVDADSLKSDNFYFNEQDFSLTGKQSGERYRMGDEVTIVVKDVAIEKRQSNFEIMLKK